MGEIVNYLKILEGSLLKAQTSNSCLKANTRLKSLKGGINTPFKYLISIRNWE